MHAAAAQRVPGAAGRQTGPGHGDQRLQEAAGGRGGQVSAVFESRGMEK